MKIEFGNQEHIDKSRGICGTKRPKCRIYPQWVIERDAGGHAVRMSLAGYACRCGDPDCETLKARFPHRSAQ